MIVELVTRQVARVGAIPTALIMLEISEEYAQIGASLIENEPELEYIRNSSVTVIYLASSESKKKNYKEVLADCTKVSPRYSWCCPCDFMITVYEPNVELLDDKQKEILIFHELQHVGINDEGNEPSYYVKPHDVEDFDNLIERYGLHWEK